MPTQADLERVFYGAYLGYSNTVIATKSLSQLRADFVANGPQTKAQNDAAYARLGNANTWTAAQSLGSVGLNGNAPVAKAAAIVAPSGGLTVDTQARDAINAIRVALSNIGITA